MMLPLVGQGRPCPSHWSQARVRPRSWLHLGTSYAGQGEVLFLLTLLKTWHPFSLGMARHGSSGIPPSRAWSPGKVFTGL